MTHYPKHKLDDNGRHIAGSANTTVVVDDSGTHLHEIGVLEAPTGDSIAKRGSLGTLSAFPGFAPDHVVTHLQAPYRVQKVSATFGVDDLTASAVSEDINLEAHTGISPLVPENSLIVGGYINTLVEWEEGTAVADLSAQVGNAADFDQLIDTTVITDAGLACVRGDEMGQFGFHAAYDPTVRFSSTVDLDTFTAGACSIHILYIELG